ncbi:MAG: putative immunity protein, partial [Candidatus Pacearchaeota archaeon]
SWDIKPIEVDPKKVNLLYAIYCAEAVLSIYEEQYPNDDRVRKCIEAAKTCFKNPSKENRDKAYSDAADTDADAYAANAATAAGYAATAAYAANATAYYAAYATAYYADNAAAFFAANAIKYARQAAKRTNKNIDFDSLLAKAQEDIWEYTQETTSSLRFSEEWDIKPILNSGYQADTIEDFISIAGPRQVWKTFDSIKAKYFYFILGNAYRYEISNFNTVFIYSIMWFYDEPKITYPISWNVKGIYNFGETDFPLIFVKDSPLINSWDIPEIDEFEVGDKVKIKSWIVFSWYCDNVGNKDFYNSDKRILEIIRTDYEKHPGWPKVWEDGEIVISIIHKDVNYTNATPKVISIPVSKAKEAIIKI